MLWRRRPPRPDTEPVERSRATRDPLVLAITEPLTRETVGRLVARVGRIADSSPVVVDLSAIPAFDSVGTAALVGLQERLGSDRVSIIGLQQATARLLGDLEPTAEPTLTAGAWVSRRLRATLVVQVDGDRLASTDDLDPVLRAALQEPVAIVVLDLRRALLTPTGLQAIAFASSAAAVAGQELLVVNVEPATGEELRRAGLSESTYVAPAPLD